MRLLSLKLLGQYKGLKDQYFDFHQAEGNILAFIGLNGSGKSQLLELIGEIFAFLERKQRKDFKVKTSLGFGFEIEYEINLPQGARHLDGLGIGYSFPSLSKYKVVLHSNKTTPHWMEYLNGDYIERNINAVILPYVIGYSSGLNENLQRSFMKNSVQFFEIQRLKTRFQKELLGKEINEEQYSKIEGKYAHKYPHIFGVKEKRDTALSNLIYLDYDNASLMLLCMAIFPNAKIDEILHEVTFKYPIKAVFQFDLRNVVIEDDRIRDIKLLIEIAGNSQFQGIGSKTTDEQYELYEFDYLAGKITLDLTDSDVKERLQEKSYGDPLSLFNKLYKLQLLGVKNWQYDNRCKLQNDKFMGTVKKPLKTKLPVSLVELVLSDGNGREVCFDDLSDGEAQLIQILATAKMFSNEQALFLFDEPETHLNPSWRTYFHSYLNKAMECENSDSQAFVSTHSPFMVSSLKRNNVYHFRRSDNGLIDMTVAQNETYGASFDVLIKDLFDMRSLISQSVIDEIRKQLKKGDSDARKWIEANLGLSAEKAYLISKLSQ